MNRNLHKALKAQKKQNKKENLQIAGSLGVKLGGQKLTEVPNRNSYVYVRLRDNENEVIQAFNNKVSPSYNLPVIVERQSTRYVVVSVDTVRYQSNWPSFAPYLPRHGNTHSFFTENGGGGDIAWIYPRQFMPSLVMPSGSLGGPNVILNEYVLKNADGTWKYVGNTGTANLTQYNPTGSSAVMALVYLDSSSGNPYIIVGSGSYFSNTVTGTSQIVPYIPTLTNPDYIPLSAIRIVSGTSIISWDNIYDVRQFIHTIPTGTGGSGGATGTSMTIWDEGIPQGSATILNFIGSNVDASVSGTVARIFVTGSTGGSISYITGTNGVGQTYYFNSILAMETEGANAMRDMGTMMATDGAADFALGSLGTGQTTFPTVWITPKNWPGIQDISKGIFRAYVSGRQDSGTRSITASVKIYKQDTAGTQTLLTTTSSGVPFVTGSFTTVELYVEDGPFYLSVTDRLVAKVVLTGGATGTDAQVTIRVKSSNKERLEIPGGTNKLVRDEDYGWIPVPDDWLRTGNHTLLMSGNLSEVLRKGTKIRYVNTSGSFSYGAVGSVTGGGTTTVNLIVNTDYIASGTLVNKFVSYIENPAGFPTWFNYAPAYSAGPGMFFAAVTTDVAKWSIAAGRCHVLLRAFGIVSGTPTIDLFATAPVNCASSLDTALVANTYDSGNKAGIGLMEISSQKLRVLKYDSSNWGIGSTKYILVEGTYEF